MYTKEQILNILGRKKPELQGRYPISELGIFGSYARGDYNEKSDINILVDFNDRIGIGFIALAHELEDLFNQKIDLVSRRAIKSRYLPFVEKNLILV
jgi:predicted nucleotidyltransferase